MKTLRRIVAVLVILLISAPAFAQEEELLATDQQIKQAISAGKKYVVTCLAEPGFWRQIGEATASSLAGKSDYYTGSYRVSFVSNLGLIWAAAERAKARYEEFSIEDIDPLFRIPSLTLIISAVAANAHNLRSAGEVGHVIIRRRKTKREDTLQPLSVKTDRRHIHEPFWG